MSIRRINKELVTAPKEGAIQFKELINDNILQQVWTVICDEGDTVAFNGVTITVNITLTSDYPWKAPKVLLDKNIYHPNVSNGKLCLITLNEWHPKTSVYNVMEEVKKVIMYPNTDVALCDEAAKMFVQNRDKYVMKAIRSIGAV